MSAMMQTMERMSAQLANQNSLNNGDSSRKNRHCGRRWCSNQNYNNNNNNNNWNNNEHNINENNANNNRRRYGGGNRTRGSGSWLTVEVTATLVEVEVTTAVEDSPVIDTLAVTVAVEITTIVPTTTTTTTTHATRIGAILFDTWEFLPYIRRMLLPQRWPQKYGPFCKHAGEE